MRAGDSPLSTGFIDRYLEGVVYPERYAGASVVVAMALAVGTAEKRAEG